MSSFSQSNSCFIVLNIAIFRLLIVIFSLLDFQSPTHGTSKAKLISRMAKMGKPMLPLSGAVVAQQDSDQEDAVPVRDALFL